MQIDHIGYAVPDIKKAIEAFEALGYCFENVLDDKARHVFICFGSNGSVRVELISPSAQGSPVDGVLKNKMGGGTVSSLLSSA